MKTLNEDVHFVTDSFRLAVVLSHVHCLHTTNAACKLQVCVKDVQICQDMPSRYDPVYG